MSFKDMVAADIKAVFLNTDEFGEKRDILFDGTTYWDVACLLTQVEDKNRSTTMSDHAQGIYRVTAVLHCQISDIGGIKPETGQMIRISDDGFMQRYLVASSACPMGMARIELEALDE